MEIIKQTTQFISENLIVLLSVVLAVLIAYFFKVLFQITTQNKVSTPNESELEDEDILDEMRKSQNIGEETEINVMRRMKIARQKAINRKIQEELTPNELREEKM